MLSINKTRNYNALAVAAFAISLYGTNAVVMKVGIETMDPLLFSSLRFFLIGLILLSFVHSLSFLKNKWLLLQLGVSVAFIIVFVVAFPLGVDASTALKASILGLTTPIFVYLFSLILLHEPAIKRVLIGGMISLTGGLMLIGLPVVLGQTLVLGDVLLLTAYASVAAGIVHAKYMYTWLAPNELISLRFILAGGLVLAYVAISSDWSTLPLGDSVAWWSLLYCTIVPGVIANGLYYWSLHEVRAEDTAPIYYLEPLVGAAAAATLLGERLAVSAVIGAVVILAGVLLSHPHHVRVFHHYHVHTKHHKSHFMQRLFARLGVIDS
ncbi:MAG: DMT family transporter [Candidatus Saccharimonadales bacterium]